MEPTLEERLRAADPLAGTIGSDSEPDRDWLERTSRAVATQPASRRSRTWIVAAALLVVAATAGAPIVRAASGGGPAADAPGPDLTVTELAMAPDAPSMSSCVPFSTGVLAGMPVGFSGEVTTRTSDAVVVTVDKWYRGPGTDQVRLLAPDMSSTSVGDVIDFQPGARYLVTATDGVVNYCGFTALWSQGLADSFAAAFGAGE